MNQNTSIGSAIAVIGGAVFDRKYHARGELVFGTSNPVDGNHSHGGVARNVAENLARLGVPTRFVSIIGQDDTGAALLHHLRELGVDVGSVVQASERPTAEYAAILDTGNDLVLGIADMAIFDLFSVDDLARAWPGIAGAQWVLADCNISAPVLAALIDRCKTGGIRLAVDTVSTPKAVRIQAHLKEIDLLFTNRDEANAILDAESIKSSREPADAAHQLGGAGLRAAVITDGAKGYVLLENGAVTIEAATAARPVDITGAGDAMVAGTLCRLLDGDRLHDAARAGATLAARTTETTASVLPDLTSEFFSSLITTLSTQGTAR